jgi:hypothetical protein
MSLLDDVELLVKRARAGELVEVVPGPDRAWVDGVMVRGVLDSSGCFRVWPASVVFQRELVRLVISDLD